MLGKITESKEISIGQRNQLSLQAVQRWIQLYKDGFSCTKMDSAVHIWILYVQVLQSDIIVETLCIQRILCRHIYIDFIEDFVEFLNLL